MSSTASLPTEAVTSESLTTENAPKRWYQRNWLIISLLIVFPFLGIPLALVSKWKAFTKLLAIGAGSIWLLYILSGSGSEPANATSSSAYGYSQAPTAAQVVPARPASDLHQKFESRGRAITANTVRLLSSLSSNNQFIDNIEGDIVMVELTAENTSDASGNFLFSQFKLVDSKGRKFDEISDFTYTMWRSENGYGSRSDDFYPGESRPDVVAFRVAPDASGFKLKWNGQSIALGQ